MRPLGPAFQRMLGLALAASAGWALPAGAEPLQPWQMVRSLQLVQDRLADGDQAALPMQRKLLEMIDARLRAAAPAELAEPRNWDAVMIYATAGGNPATVKALMPDLLAAADAVAAHAEAAAKAAAGEETPKEEVAPDTQSKEGGHPEEGAHAETPADSHGSAAKADARKQAEHVKGHVSGSGGHDASGATAEHSLERNTSDHPEPATAHQSHAEAEHGGKAAAQHEAPAPAHGSLGETEHGSGATVPRGVPATAHDALKQAQPAEAAGGHESPSAAHGGKAETDPVVTHSVEKSSGHGGGEAEGGHGETAHGEGKDKDGEKAAGEHAEAPQVQNRDLALGVYNYGRGRAPDAARALSDIDPMRQRPELGAFVALVKGSLAAKENPAGALKLLDQARLIAPGTLVEEAALRRTLGLAIVLKDRGRFLLGSSQYVRRFLRSPYASQFADAFVAGVIALNEGLDLQAVADVTSNMAPEQERVVYLRIARQAGIDNLMALSAFASDKADAKPEEVTAQGDPRTALYAALSEITGERSGEAVARLDALDPSRLTLSDRELLAAVRAIAAETVRPPAELPPPANAVAPVAAGTPASDEQPALEVPPKPEAEGPPDAQAGTSPASGQPAADAVDQRMAATREALADVDKLLVEADK